MSRLILKSIEEVVYQYIDSLSHKYKLEKKELIERWEEMSPLSSSTTTTTPAMKSTTIATNTSKTPGNKKQGYQYFFTVKRNEYKTQHPDMMNYSHLNKEISHMWNALSETDKQKYGDDAIIQQQSSMVAIIERKQYTFEELNKKKMTELKEICEEYGIKKGGNKSELIKNLLGQADSTNVEKAKLAMTSSSSTSVINPDLSVEIEYAKKTETRVDFQQEENEEESDFEEEDDANSVESKHSDITESSISLNDDDYDML